MKKSIEVLYIITKLELGGAQKVCISLLEGLQQTGNRALLISGAEGVLVETVKKNPYVIVLENFKREISFRYCLTELKNFVRLINTIKFLKQQHPHLIVHTHSTKAGLVGRWAAFFAGIKIRIHTVHGYAFHKHQPFVIWLSIYLLELFTSIITTHFICVSSEDVKTGKRLFPRFEKKHSIIRAAVAWEQFIPARQTLLNEQNLFIFGTIACFKKQKNLFDVLQAFAHVYAKNSNTRLEIIGDGALRPALEAWITEHSLTGAITLHGWQQQVVPFMMNWHTFVLSSLWEGLPCAIVEARLLKLPVLSYHTGGIHDIIFSGENGFLYKQKDWRALAEGMLSLTVNKQLYKKLQNYQDNLEDFKQHKMINQHIKLYQSF